MSERLTKSMRLRKRREFLAVQGGGSKVSCRNFLALATRRPDPGPGRIGLTVTRKIGNAVTRNRIRRMVREWLRRHGWIPAGWDVVIIAREGAATLRSAFELGPDMGRIQRSLRC